jgi:transcriptional regulator with XRE-family HTH domain
MEIKYGKARNSRRNIAGSDNPAVFLIPESPKGGDIRASLAGVAPEARHSPLMTNTNFPCPLLFLIIVIMCHIIHTINCEVYHMARNSLSKNALPPSVQQAIKTLGENIQTARKRRRWSMEEMAGSMLVTRKTLARLEAGDPAAGISVLATALHILDMTDDLKNIAAPEKDAMGLFYEKQRLPKRVRTELTTTTTKKLDF